MATIEPRLMHLLNGSGSKSSPFDLPPIQNISFASPGHALSLPPLELDVIGQRADPPLAPKSIPSLPLHAHASDDNAARQALSGEDPVVRPKNLGHSLRLLLDEPEGAELPNSLRKILDDMPDAVDDPSTKKRHRALTNKDELIHLPQPLKKQKSSQQVIPRAQVVPPIINGLHEPPPNAAVFPPISAADFPEDDASNRALLKEFGPAFSEAAAPNAAADGDKPVPGSRKRIGKPRRKWSEQETAHLLLGVSRHGVGKWTTILEDPDYCFNERTAGDLKDRFRTCCPNELRHKLGKRDRERDATKSKSKTKTNLTLENILIDPETPERDKDEPDLALKPKRSRAHRKNLEDLAELGICGPFKKSLRRERRHFTEQDDTEILQGLDEYGPAWTKIQRDPRFHLSSRQPTDLRDRVRNKYPEIYARIEKGNPDIRDGGRASGLLEPSVHTTMENSLTGSKSLNRTSSKEWPLPLSLLDPFEPAESQVSDMLESSATALVGNVGEMGISRLLLDDSRSPADL